MLESNIAEAKLQLGEDEIVKSDLQSRYDSFA